MVFRMGVKYNISFRRWWFPAVSAMAFVIIGALLFMIQIHITDNEWVPLSDILLQSPICYFWILWFGMIFFSASGFVREYENRLVMAQTSYPLVRNGDIRKFVKKDMAYSYSKKLFLVFAGIPLLYLSMHYDKQSGFSMPALLISIIPLVINLIVFAMLRHQFLRKV